MITASCLIINFAKMSFLPLSVAQMGWPNYLSPSNCQTVNKQVDSICGKKSTITTIRSAIRYIDSHPMTFGFTDLRMQQC